MTAITTRTGRLLRVVGVATALCLATPALVTSGLVMPARADTEVTVEDFEEPLAEDGDWISHPRHGRVWYPRDVDYDWRPYTVGRWVYTEDYGWMWESEERWGWATYHYGRWDFDQRFGWIWIPGTEWGPAWVEWRRSDDYIGWAPLPPAARWRNDRIVYSERIDYEAPRWRPAWVFVSAPLFVRPGLHRICEPPSRNVRIVSNTTVITNYTTVNRTIINRSLAVEQVSRITKSDIRPVRVERAVTLGARHDAVQTRRTDVAVVFRPSLQTRQERRDRRANPGAAPVVAPVSAPATPSVTPSVVAPGSPPISAPVDPSGARNRERRGPDGKQPGTAPGQSSNPPPAAVTGVPPPPVSPPPAVKATIPPATIAVPPAASASRSPPPTATPSPAGQKPAQLDALRQRQQADREALRQQQRDERVRVQPPQQPIIQREQARERTDQLRIQQQQREVVINRPQPPRVPPPAPSIARAPPPQSVRAAPPPPPVVRAPPSQSPSQPAKKAPDEKRKPGDKP